MSFNPAYAYPPPQAVAVPASSYQGQHYSIAQPVQYAPQYAPQPHYAPQAAPQPLPAYQPAPGQQQHHYHNGPARPVAYQPQHAQSVGVAAGSVTSQCGRCGAGYPLPPGAESWRCKSCQAMNGSSTLGCAIL